MPRTSCATRSSAGSSRRTTASRASASRRALVYLDNQTRASGVDARAAVQVLERLLGEIGEDGSSVSLTLVRDRAMRVLNREHRGKDAPTDVLSFPLHPPEAFDRTGRTRPLGRDGESERMLGDIVISVDTARRQAADYDATVDREVQRLLIHAVLHLAGHDHHEPDERAHMEAEERRLAESIGMPWPYLDALAR